MYIKELKLFNFKNYEQENFAFGAKFNCLLGDNGMGKTNVLDAIYYLCMCKSHFSILDKQIVRHEQAFFRLDGFFDLAGKKEHIVCKYQQKQSKVFERNRVVYEKLSQHIGLLPVVMITPNDTSLVTEGSELRRQFIDITLVQLDRAYLQALISYNKLLKQRNSYLKQCAGLGVDEQLLNIYDEQMLEPAKYIAEKRQAFLQTFKPLFEHYYEKIANKQEEMTFVYKSHSLEGNLKDIFQQSREKDIILQRTTKGVHKDELQFLIGELALKKFASQGQMKSYILALKMAQYHCLAQAVEHKPILLLDDIFDKLDSKRVRQLLQLLQEDTFGQVFISDTEELRVQAILEGLKAEVTCYGIKKGRRIEL